MGADLSSGGGDELAPISAINVTPFVDVVLVLLVIFMVTAPGMMKHAIDLKLPKAATGEARSQAPLGVVVTRQGQILINGQLVDDATLVTQVKDALQKNPETQALIAADQESKHGDVVRAIDLLRSAGLTRFAFQIEKSSP